MSAKFEIHASDCPRLCQRFLPGRDCGHTAHGCLPCPGSQMVAVDRKELEELVEAAEKMFDPTDGYPVQRSGRHWFRLDAALQPFRRGE